jgi:putative addiction module antidote
MASSTDNGEPPRPAAASSLLKITKVGNSAGLLLPKEALARLRVEQGDTVFLTGAPDGFRITPYDPGFERQMGVARKVMKKHRPALRELAK